MNRKPMIIFIAIFIVLILSRLIMPEEHLYKFVTAVNIALVFAAALMSFLILNVIMKQKENLHFHIEELKLSWNMLTLTIFFLALGHIFGLVIPIDEIVYKQNLTMVFLLILIGGLYYFYKAITKVKNNGKRRFKQKS